MSDRTPSGTDEARRRIEAAIDCILAELERLPDNRARLFVLTRATAWTLDGGESLDHVFGYGDDDG